MSNKSLNTLNNAVAVDGTSVTGNGTTEFPLATGANMTPVLTDGVTITGTGVTGDPLVAVGGGGGSVIEDWMTNALIIYSGVAVPSPLLLPVPTWAPLPWPANLPDQVPNATIALILRSHAQVVGVADGSGDFYMEYHIAWLNTATEPDTYETIASQTVAYQGLAPSEQLRFPIDLTTEYWTVPAPGSALYLLAFVNAGAATFGGGEGPVATLTATPMVGAQIVFG
jgi:hypothetical protein